MRRTDDTVDGIDSSIDDPVVVAEYVPTGDPYRHVHRGPIALLSGASRCGPLPA